MTYFTWHNDLKVHIQVTVAYDRISFPFKNNILLYVYTVPCFAYLYINGQCSGFYLSAIVKSASTNMGIQIHFQDPAFPSFEYLCSSEIAGSCGSSSVNFLRHLHIVFYSGCIILQYYQPQARFTNLFIFLPILVISFSFFLLLIVAILIACMISHYGFDLEFSDDQ